MEGAPRQVRNARHVPLTVRQKAGQDIIALRRVDAAGEAAEVPARMVDLLLERQSPKGRLLATIPRFLP